MQNDPCRPNTSIRDYNCPMIRFLGIFNGDISEWDVLSSAQDMHRMFWSAISFNSDLSKWDVSSVQDVGHMFSDTELFNSDVSKWDISNVVNMDHMF